MSRKKIIVVLLSAVMLCTAAPVSANAETLDSYSAKEYSDNTVVTSDNIEGILDSLGIEHGSFIYDPTVDVKSYTVKELKNILSNLNVESENTNETNDFEEVDNTDSIGEINNNFETTEVNNNDTSYLQIQDKPMRSASKVYMKKLSYTGRVGDAYTLTHTVDAYCVGNKFKSAGETDISIDYDISDIYFKTDISLLYWGLQ
ncbi:MAG: hypothetical protein ACI4CS_09305 [Candidatus Weimeria sp.]